MNKVYIFVHSSDLGTSDEIRDFIDAQREIVNWKRELPNCYYLISPSSAQELSDALQRLRTGKDASKFIVAELTENRQGFLDPNSWTFLRDRKAVWD